jgi:hypothetical protein
MENTADENRKRIDELQKQLNELKLQNHELREMITEYNKIGLSPQQIRSYFIMIYSILSDIKSDPIYHYAEEGKNSELNYILCLIYTEKSLHQIIGINENSINGKNDKIPIVAAAINMHINCVQTLIQFGADLKIKDKNGHGLLYNIINTIQTLTPNNGLYMPLINSPDTFKNIITLLVNNGVKPKNMQERRELMYCYDMISHKMFDNSDVNSRKYPNIKRILREIRGIIFDGQ